MHAGDVARSLHDARRTLLMDFQESAEAFSPVLYLRGRQPACSTSAAARWCRPSAPAQAAPAVSRDSCRGPAAGAARAALLAGARRSPPGRRVDRSWWRPSARGCTASSSPALGRARAPALSAVAQRYVLQFNAERLRTEFKVSDRSPLPAVPLVDGAGAAALAGVPPHPDEAARAGSGARASTGRTLALYVIRPSPEDSEAPTILRHVRGAGLGDPGRSCRSPSIPAGMWRCCGSTAADSPTRTCTSRC